MCDSTGVERGPGGKPRTAPPYDIDRATGDLVAQSGETADSVLDCIRVWYRGASKRDRQAVDRLFAQELAGPAIPPSTYLLP